MNQMSFKATLIQQQLIVFRERLSQNQVELTSGRTKLEQFLQQAHDLGETALASRILNTHANLLRSFGREDEALPYLEQALAAAQAAGEGNSAHGMGVSLNIALYHANHQHFDRARQAFDTILTHLDFNAADSDVFNIGILALLNRCAMHYNTGAYEAALHDGQHMLEVVALPASARLNRKRVGLHVLRMREILTFVETQRGHLREAWVHARLMRDLGTQLASPVEILRAELAAYFIIAHLDENKDHAPIDGDLKQQSERLHQAVQEAEGDILHAYHAQFMANAQRLHDQGIKYAAHLLADLALNICDRLQLAADAPQRTTTRHLHEQTRPPGT